MRAFYLRNDKNLDTDRRANSGASMSGDLKNPSKAIPKGTLYGLGVTFFSYTVVILAMAATITRASFYRNANVIQDVILWGPSLTYRC